MKEIYKVECGKEFFGHEAINAYHVFRTMDSMICWSTERESILWEIPFPDDQISAEKALVVSSGLAVTPIALNSNRLAIKAIEIPSGKLVWETKLILDLVNDCICVVGDKIVLYCSNEDEYRLISINPLSFWCFIRHICFFW